MERDENPSGREPPSFDDLRLGPGDEGALVAGGRYERVRFVGLDAASAGLPDATFLDCTFEGCDLTMADMRGATVRGVRFETCRLLGVDLGSWRDDGLGVEATFQGCDLDRVRAVGLDLRACTFEGGRARASEWTRCDLREVAFDDVDLDGARFAGCDLRDADLRSARRYRIDPGSNRVEGVRVALPEALSFLEVVGVRLDG